MSKEISVFNKKSTAHVTGNHPLFLGEELGAYDSINVNHPYLFEQMEKLKQLDWSQDDLDLSQTRMDLVRSGKGKREFMLFNLAYQWSLDSIATSIPTLLAPFITNNEMGHLFARIGENENLHSLTYSNIVRQCVSDPQEVFDMIYKHEQVLERSVAVSKALSELKEAGAKYTLGMITKDEAKPFIVKGMVAIYALERVSFMSSFSCTFAMAEQGWYVNAARLVQKILIDEKIHIDSGRYVLSQMMNDPEFEQTFIDCRDEIQSIVDGVVAQEHNWNEYLFQGERSVVGLNCPLLNDWSSWNANEVYSLLKLDHTPIKEVPLAWFSEWEDINSQQNANMESDPTNYMVSSVSREAIDAPDCLDELGIDLQ